MIALLCYYSNFMVDFDNMPDDQLAKKWGQLQFALEKTGQYRNG